MIFTVNLIGTGARIDYAVVVKDVHMGATVVGVPGGHVVVKRNGEDKSAKREAMARKIGFDAYAERKDLPDPIQNALDSISDHMHKVDKALEELKRKAKDN